MLVGQEQIERGPLLSTSTVPSPFTVAVETVAIAPPVEVEGVVELLDGLDGGALEPELELLPQPAAMSTTPLMSASTAGVFDIGRSSATPCQK